jgi:ribosomal protein L29
MKLAEIKKLEKEDLAKKISEWSQELVDLRFQAMTQKLKEVSKIDTVKKQIARAQTFYVQKTGVKFYAIEYVGVKMAPVKAKEKKAEKAPKETKKEEAKAPKAVKEKKVKAKK